MALITEKRVRHLPVLENDRVIGVLSIGDMVKDTISEKDFIIEQLVNYIRDESDVSRKLRESRKSP